MSAFRPPTSFYEGIAWPGFPSTAAAVRLALLRQMEETQWLSRQAILSRQLLQLSQLLRHVWATVPYYRDRLEEAGIVPDRALDYDTWLKLKPLRRGEVQSAGEALVSTAVPKEHGAIGEASTSGSTGEPVRVLSTQVTSLIWDVATLREHLWQQRDLSAKMAVIRRISGGRAAYPGGLHLERWGRAVGSVFRTGPLVALEIETSIANQVEWLQREEPAYLRVYPTNLLSLANHCIAKGIALPRLKQCLTFSELLRPEVREACREAFGVTVADAYSSQEVGYISLQAPGHEHHLVQADCVLVEVVDEDGRLCKPGQVGRVIVTALHNFAKPFLRYDIGDYAEVGEPCPTGRQLPVLKRILGRERNMLIDAAGGEYWPAFGVRGLLAIVPVRQFQLAQTGLGEVEARMVVDEPLAPEKEAEVMAHFRSRLPEGFTVVLKYVRDIPRSAGGKFEDFVCEIERPEAPGQPDP